MLQPIQAKIKHGDRGEGMNTSEWPRAAALSVDISCILQKVGSVTEARALPRGAVIGDRHGGLTFTDVVAAALEARSGGGWQEFRAADGETWTIIVLNR
jgi:hypothetical protein